MIDKVVLVSLALERRFPDGDDPFQMVTRLAEEAGELAAEVQHWEGTGIKREKHGPPDRDRTAKEVLDVLVAAVTIARRYDVLDALDRRLDEVIERAVSEGLLSSDEASSR